jgi:hypothetical protein
MIAQEMVDTEVSYVKGLLQMFKVRHHSRHLCAALCDSAAIQGDHITANIDYGQD